MAFFHIRLFLVNIVILRINNVFPSIPTLSMDHVQLLFFYLTSFYAPTVNIFQHLVITILFSDLLI